MIQTPKFDFADVGVANQLARRGRSIREATQTFTQRLWADELLDR